MIDRQIVAKGKKERRGQEEEGERDRDVIKRNENYLK